MTRRLGFSAVVRNSFSWFWPASAAWAVRAGPRQGSRPNSGFVPKRPDECSYDFRPLC